MIQPCKLGEGGTKEKKLPEGKVSKKERWETSNCGAKKEDPSDVKKHI